MNLKLIISFALVGEADYIKRDDNTLVVTLSDGTQLTKLEYHPNNDHITVTDRNETEMDEFIRVE
jgi:hypothetical protein